MNLKEIVFEIFKDALPFEEGMKNWKIIGLILILYYDVFCNKHDIPYIQFDVYMIIEFLHDITVIWLWYWCWVYKIENNDNHIITLAYVAIKHGQRKLSYIFTYHLSQFEFVSANFRNGIDLDF